MGTWKLEWLAPWKRDCACACVCALLCFALRCLAVPCLAVPCLALSCPARCGTTVLIEEILLAHPSPTGKRVQVIKLYQLCIPCFVCAPGFPDTLSHSPVRLASMTTVLSGHGNNKCKLQWVQEGAKVNIPLFTCDPACVSSSPSGDADFFPGSSLSKFIILKLPICTC